MEKVLLFLCIGCGISFAQDIQKYVVEQDSSKKNDRYTLYKSDFSLQSEGWVLAVNGSPYLNSEWNKGIASMKENWSFKAPMRYNAEREIIEFLDEDNRRKEFKKVPLIQAKFDGKTYKLLSFVEDGAEKTGYFNPLMNRGTVKLYFRPKVKIVKLHATGNISTYRDFICTNNSSYYLRNADNLPQKIKLNRKSLLNALSDQKEVLERYINGYKLNLRKEADVIRLLNFYNALSHPNIPEIQNNHS